MSKHLTEGQRAARLEATRRWRKRNPEKQRAASLKWRKENPEKALQSRRASYLKFKKQVFDAYGNRCACCGESNLKFLTLDHVQNQGATHRRSLKQGTYYVFKSVIEAGFPKDLYRLLCWNCNCGRAMNGGVCPHEESRT